TIEQELLVPLAEGLNRYAADATLSAAVRVEEDELRVTVRPHTADTRKPTAAAGAGRHGAEWNARAAQLRRTIQTLEQSPTALELQNEIVRLEQLERRLASRRWKSPADLARVAQLPGRRQLAESLKSLAGRVTALEGEALLALYGRAAFAEDRTASEWATLESAWKHLLLSMDSLRFKNPDGATLPVYSEHSVGLVALAHAYYALASDAGGAVDVTQITAGRAGRAQDTALERQSVSKPKEFFAASHPGGIGIALGIRGPFVFPRYEPER